MANLALASTPSLVTGTDYGSTYNVAKTIDNNVGTQFWSIGNGDVTIEWDLGANYDVREFILCRGSAGNYNFQFKYKDGGGTWQDVSGASGTT